MPLLHSVGRVLATPVHAAASLPPWANSAMDGYAVRAADVAAASETAPVRLRVVETIAAGSAPSVAVSVGQASRIMTGAPLPAGADCVVRVEDTDGGVDVVTIRSGRDAGRNVRPAGEDVAVGATALDGGILVGGAQLALLAALGEMDVGVARSPRVALLASGDELVPPERSPAGGPERGVVATNSLALAALLRADGATPVDLGVARDSIDDIASRAAGAAGCDLLVTTGGASVGEFDYTQRAVAKLGLELDFWRVRVRPGAQTAFGRLAALGGLPWLGLPGNPVSAQVTYELFVRPLVRLWLGVRLPFRCPVAVDLAAPVTGLAREHFLPRARLAVAPDGRLTARLTGPQGSNILSSTARADALLVVPPGSGVAAAGSPARALVLGENPFHAAGSPW